MTNSDLIPAGQAPSHQTVAPIQSVTAPLPYVKSKDVKCYICTVPAASFIRNDGKRIPFVYGFCETDNKFDIEHLDREIDNNNAYVRLATEQEIREAHMRLNPRATMEAEAKKMAMNDPDLRAELEDKIRRELEAGKEADVVTSNTGQQNLSRVDALRAQATKVATQSGSATITPMDSGEVIKNDAGTSTPAKITPTSSADIKDAAARS